MEFEKLEDFYQVYDSHRVYVKAEVRKKHIRNFDQQFWLPAQVNINHSVIELGTGTGLFLAYLEAKGLKNFKGIDGDAHALGYMPPSIAEKVTICDVWDALKNPSEQFDRIVMFDFFEHFSYFEGQRLLSELREHLAEGGKIIIRIPNASSPFSWQYQFGDLTHKSVYAPSGIVHLALAAGYVVERHLPVRRGNRFKQFMENIAFGIMNRVFTEPPPFWSANMIVVMSLSKEK
ncbi:MAG: methyltransferase domain-containing protein [Rhodospirillales bacterium]|nr:methyltransferase domain-containing protein [Rhodospirillales bacterium]